MERQKRKTLLRENLLRRLLAHVEYWDTSPGLPVRGFSEARAKMEGLVHSILFMFDNGLYEIVAASDPTLCLGGSLHEFWDERAYSGYPRDLEPVHILAEKLHEAARALEKMGREAQADKQEIEALSTDLVRETDRAQEMQHERDEYYNETEVLKKELALLRDNVVHLWHATPQEVGPLRKHLNMTEEEYDRWAVRGEGEFAFRCKEEGK